MPLDFSWKDGKTNCFEVTVLLDRCFCSEFGEFLEPGGTMRVLIYRFYFTVPTKKARAILLR